MLRIRILDTDVNRLMKTDTQVRSTIKKAGIQANVIPVADNLEINRCGVMGRLPAVEINGCVVSKGKSVTGEEVLSMVRRFAP